MRNDLVTSPLPTVLPAFEQLRQEVLDEQLLSKTVDMNYVAAELLTPFLSAVESRCFVDHCVTRSFLAAAVKLGPPRRVCAIRHHQSVIAGH